MEVRLPSASATLGIIWINAGFCYNDNDEEKKSIVDDSPTARFFVLNVKWRSSGHGWWADVSF